MSKICGIYKITSPSKRVYIGQSVDIKSRWRAYRNNPNRGQTLLERSFKKYGYDNHKFEIIQVCVKEELNNLEIYYIQLFDTFNGKFGLNLKGGGHSGGMCSEEAKAKMRKPKSEEAKENYRQAALRRPPVSEETREKHRKRMLGNKNLTGNKIWLGRTHSEESKAVIKAKRANQIMKSGYKREEFSSEWKANMRKAQTGENNNNYKHGKKCKLKPNVQLL